ncbi:MAG: GDP-L-fucose synthase [Deltaproteobacteria bacterium]|nr:GDP-L-fucose synthase [Deltaproteobacteria bacterium]MBW1794230.1 GDP-L-fucose synthase [Deltaproteobacteria bacterium]MBW2331105.1 GDP-L-fucose synthase [Deltaproteobacteria bacterium]
MELDSKIYIAGHRGLVGSAIHRKLKEKGYANIIARTRKELDLERQAPVESFFQEQRPEYVFLAAAKVGGIWANNSFPAEFIYSNIMVQTNLIHSAYRTGVRKLLFLGSSCIYPKNCPQPMKEEHLLTGPLEPTNEPYAVAKIAGIKTCQSYNRQYGTNYVSVMPTNLYGPNDNFDLETSHVLAAMIRKFHLAKLAAKGDWEGIQNDETYYGPIPEDVRTAIGFSVRNPQSLRGVGPSGPEATIHNPQSVVLWGTGTPKREFLHVDDLADACIFLMSHYDESDIINIGCGEDVSIAELALLVKDIVGYTGNIEYDTEKPDGTPLKLLDVSKLRGLGWKPKISLEEGIRKTYQWYCRSAA